jgi:hypothetical protein
VGVELNVAFPNIPQRPPLHTPRVGTRRPFGAPAPHPANRQSLWQLTATIGVAAEPADSAHLLLKYRVYRTQGAE